MTKLKRFRAILSISTILLAGVMLVFASCAPAAPAPAPITAPPTEPERMPPAVLVIPNVGTSREKVNFVGANFEPGEEVMVAVLIFLGIETSLSGGSEGLTIKADELGSFQIVRKLPHIPGVYPVRVYDKAGKMIVSTVAMVVEKE